MSNDQEIPQSHTADHPILHCDEETQTLFSSHGGFLTITMYHNLIKLTHYDKTKKRGHDPQIVLAKENLKLSHGGTS